MFKTQTCKVKRGEQNLRAGTKMNLLKQQYDEDVLMSAGSNNNSRQPVNRGRSRGRYTKGRNSPLPHGDSRHGRPGQLQTSDSNWYKIFVSIHL